MDELLEILERIKPGVDFRNENNIVGSKILDSLSIMRLVSEIGNTFDIAFPVTELVPENFNSVEAMMNMIERLQDE